MRFVVLAAAAALVIASASNAADAPAAAARPSAGEEMALLVDFVEIGRVDRAVPRDIAMVDLLNLSPHVLDVAIGEGSATLQPKERMIARVKAGDQPVTVTTREKGIEPMEGRVRLDGGVRYEMALAYGAVPKVSAEMAAPGIDTGSGGTEAQSIAPRPADSRQGVKPRRTPRTKDGKVEIGRRPRR